MLQRRKNLMFFTNGPTSSVLVMLRTGAAIRFSATKWTTTPWPRNAWRGENAAGQSLEAPIINQRETSRMTIRKQNTQRFCERYTWWSGKHLYELVPFIITSVKKRKRRLPQETRISAAKDGTSGSERNLEYYTIITSFFVMSTNAQWQNLSL